MRFAPRSLFARMVLVLLAGLAAAQLASFAIHWRERGEFMARASGARSAQRIADIVRLLDTIAPAERERILAVVNAPGMRVVMQALPLPEVAADEERAEQAQQLAAQLRRSLGDGWPLEVVVTDVPVIRGPPPGFGPGMKGGGMGPRGEGGPGIRGRPGVSFVVRTELADATPLTFDLRQPSEVVNWPLRLVLSLAVLFGAVLIVTLVAVRSVTRPLKTLAQAAEELGADINRPPLDERGPLEVSRAARAFNTMQRRLAAFIHDRSRIFAAMSHDLKTPITRMRLRTALLDDDEVRAKFEKDLAEMEAMVAATLDFMRGLENTQPAQALDVAALLDSIAEDAREVGGEVTVEGAPLAPYRGNPQTLRRCITNLVENAVKYGRTATILVEDGPDELVIRVRDGGPGIPEAELERVFEPFHRLEASRNRDTGGTGLGLTIARIIAQAHGGTLTLVNRDGGGLEATLTLPRRG
jgi:signal transduction histidine kinase